MDHSRSVAIIGVACRFPNGDTIGEFWNSLLNGMNSATEIPTDRWNNDAFYSKDKDANGMMYARHASFLKDIRGFDNKVFNITDEEAIHMDVQQKLVLEVAFKAFENAGLSLSAVNGTDTAVFIGQMHDDYKVSFVRSDVNTYTATGTANCVSSNRVSYQFNLHGTSATIDTACSSSLLCIHMGIQSILSGESTMAVCGGVNAILAPSTMLALSKARMATEKGQCFTFSDQGDGYLKGEGCGLVILKRLEQAVHDRDNIWCVITTGANQDGNTVTPITTPSSVQQQALIERLYKQCSIRPECIQYIEAHGTGTKAGDPVETLALGNTIGAARLSAGKGKCPVGSVKTNIGHLESAAGVAGLIKIMLMLKHRKFVPSLHFDTPNPNIDFDALNLTVTTKVADWPTKNGSPDMACVNSFGFGGTNVHAVIQEFPRKTAQINSKSSTSGEVLRLWPVVFSGATPEALHATLKHTLDVLQQDTESCSLQQLAYTSAARRTHFRYRLGVLASDMSELKMNISRHLAQKPAKVEPVARNARVVFVCCGMGTTYAGMGSELRHLEPVFEEALQKINKLIMECTGWSVIEKMSSEDHMSQPEFSQPALFAIQVSLFMLLDSWGIIPSAVIGHSVGEVAASYIAQRLSLEDCVKVICQRGRLMSKVRGGSMMVAENFPPGVVEKTLRSFSGRICIAAVNSTNCYTLSGDSDALDQVALQLKTHQTGENQLLKKLSVNTAFHSHHMDPITNELRNALRDVKPIVATDTNPILAYSTVTGKLVAGGDLSIPEYWVRNARGCVLFQDAFRNCMQASTASIKTVLVEIGPRPALGRYMNAISTSLQMKPTVLCTMKPSSQQKVSEQKELFITLMKMFETSTEPRWKTVFKGHETEICQIPEYQYQKKDLWHDIKEFKKNRADPSELAEESSSHCFVKRKFLDNSTFVVNLNAPETDFVQDHQLGAIPTAPGALYLETAIAGVLLYTGLKPHMITLSVSFDRLLQFTDASERMKDLEVSVWQRGNIDRAGSIHTPSFDYDLTINTVPYASGYAEVTTELCAWPLPLNLPEIRIRCTTHVSHDELYDRLAEVNFTYGKLFRSVQACFCGHDEGLAELVVCDEVVKQFPQSFLHPCLGDAVLQLSYMLDNGRLRNSKVQVVPRCIRKIRLLRTPEKFMFIHVRRNRSFSNSTADRCLIYDAVLVNVLGEVYATLDGVTISATDIEIACTAVECMYSLIWNPSDQVTNNDTLDAYLEKITTSEEKPVFIPSSEANFLVFSDANGTARRIMEKISSKGLCGSATQFIPADESFVKSFHHEHGHLQHILKNDLQFYKHVLFCWPLNESLPESSSSDEITSAVFRICYALCQIAKLMISLNVNIPIVVVTRNVCELLHSAAEISASSDRSNLLRGVIGYTIQSTVRTLGLEPDCPTIRCIDLTLCDELELDAVASSFQDVKTLAEFAMFQGKQWRPELLPVRCQLEPRQRQCNYSAKLPYQLVEIGNQQFSLLPLVSSESGSPSTKNSHSTNGYKSRISCSVLKVRIDPLSMFYANGESDREHVVQAADIIGHIEVPERKKRVTKVHVLGPCSSASVQLVDIHRCIPFLSFAIDQPVISIVFLAWYIAKVTRVRDLLLQPRLRITCKVAMPELQTIKMVIDELVHKSHKNGTSGNSPEVAVNIFFAKTQNDVREFASEAAKYGNRFSVILTNLHIANPPSSQSSFSYEIINVPGLFNKDDAKYIKKFGDWLSKNKVWLRQQYENKKLRFETDVLDLSKSSDKPMTSMRLESNQKMHVLDLTSCTDVVPVALSLQTMFRPTSHYIVIGGSRGLGWELIKHMAKIGAKNIASWSRNVPDKKIMEAVKILEQETSCRIRFQQVEVSVYSEVDKALTACRKIFPGTELSGIFHGAVVLDDTSVTRMDMHKFSRVLQAKVKGTWNLHALTKHQRLDFFVLHSSIVSIMGNPGQTNYAAANAFQDAMAVYRRKTGLVGQSINWSALNVGVILESISGVRWSKAQGLTPLSVPDINECFDYCLLTNIPRIMCARVNWRIVMKKRMSEIRLGQRRFLFPFFSKRHDKLIRSVVTTITQEIREISTEGQINEIKYAVRKIFDGNIAGFDLELNDDVDAYTLGADSLSVMNIISSVRKIYNVPASDLQALSPLTVNEVYKVILKHINPVNLPTAQSALEEKPNIVSVEPPSVLRSYNGNFEEVTRL